MSACDHKPDPALFCEECNRLATLCTELGKMLQHVVDIAPHSFTRQQAIRLLEREGFTQ